VIFFVAVAVAIESHMAHQGYYEVDEQAVFRATRRVFVYADRRCRAALPTRDFRGCLW